MGIATFKKYESFKGLDGSVVGTHLFGGLYSPIFYASDRGKPIFLRNMCTLETASTAAAEAINEQEVQKTGKEAHKTSEGTNWTFTVEPSKGDLAYPLALKGVPIGYFDDPTYGGAGQAASYFAEMNVGRGFMLDLQQDITTGAITNSIFYANVDYYCEAIGGTETSNGLRCETTYKPHRTGAGQRHVVELFWDDGTYIFNPNAPDGTLTTFQVGRGNNSLNLALPTNRGLPLTRVNAPTDFDPLASTNYKDWFVQITLNGKDVPEESIVSFDRVTGTLTFVSAPPAGSRLMIVYVLPHGKADFSPHRAYRQGEITNHNGNTYKCINPNGVASGSPFNAGDWLLIPLSVHYEGAAYRPHAWNPPTSLHDDSANPCNIANSYSFAYFKI